MVSQQTRGTALMLFQCWASVVDDGSALKQHIRRWPNIVLILSERLVLAG